MSKPASGSSRIPTFGSKILHVKQKTNLQVTVKDIGRKVRVVDKKGTLRYVGNVHFSSGTWCGIELCDPLGKHDGFVNGVRYFACLQRYGLMAPLYKVTLLTNGECENIEEDAVSGPYSMLFFDHQIPDDTSVINKNVSYHKKNDSIENIGLKSEGNRTYLNNSGDINNINVTIGANQVEKQHKSIKRRTPPRNDFVFNTTTIQSDNQNNCSINTDKTYTENEHIITHKSSENNRQEKDLICTYVAENAENVESATFCLNNTETISNQSLAKRRRTFTCDNIEENLGKRIDSVVLSSLSDTIDKPSSLPQLRQINQKQDSQDFVSTTLAALALNKFSHSTPIRGEFEESLLKKLHLSSNNLINNARLDDDSSKRDSLEFEESLGILTPDQMVDGLSHKSTFGSRTPSSEYIRCLPSDTKRKSELESPICGNFDLINATTKPEKPSDLNIEKLSSFKSDLPSPSVAECSLGILDDKYLSKFMIGSDVLNLSTKSLSTPSSEYIRCLPSDTRRKSELESPICGNFDLINATTKPEKPSDLNIEKLSSFKSDLPSPSVAECSLGILDDKYLSKFMIGSDVLNLSTKSDTTVNMELPLDKVSVSKDYNLTRLEQTPSPEDLPLDPIPVVEGDSKTEPTKSKQSNNSFITSITSITSLDTGYQGDGEMSRPASRGANNSPLTRRPLLRPQPRKPDPMTDSDFYTESDADNHEENPLRGDRKAQVIDGTLYGVDAEAAAAIYVNNRENMDSSGIFTDIESKTSNEKSLHQSNTTIDISLSDSTKTITVNSQEELREQTKLQRDKIEEKVILKENPKKRNASSPVASSPSSVRSPKHGTKEENANKKFKMPKRDVASKVKAMLEPSQQNEKRSNFKKPISRWDHVMNKISKTEQNKTNLKDIKSKVYSNVNSVSPSSAQKQKEARKTDIRSVASQNNKPRRVRARLINSSTSTKTNNAESSIHSSLSDLSATTTLPKKSIASGKKRDVVQVTQVLTASKLSPRISPNNATESKKTALSSSPSESKQRKTLFSPKEKKQNATKDCTRATVKGGRTSPAVRPPTQPRAIAKPVPKVAEALAVLVQHLVFNVEAYQVPSLKKQVQKFRLEIEEIRLACQHLEETLSSERANHVKAIEEQRLKHINEIDQLAEKYKLEILELNNQHRSETQRILDVNELNKSEVSKQNEAQLLKVKIEFEKLQKTHVETVDILREENDAIREQIDEKNAYIKQLKEEISDLKEEQTKNSKLNEQLSNANKQNQEMRTVIDQMEDKVKDQVRLVHEENVKLREENDRLLSYGDDKGISMQEVQSLRAVLDLKQNEVAQLRKALAESKQKNEILAAAEEKASALNARCEDLQLQLERKSEYETSLVAENKKLNYAIKEEVNQKKRLSQYNEELQWKLKQNKEVVSKVLEQAEESVFNRSLLSSSFNESHNSSSKHLNRTFSFKERSFLSKSNGNSDDFDKCRKTKNIFEFDMEDISPPSSPKVKGVVEKSDSVSYVLDLDESAEIVASRIVRRSFRNSTPPKNTPTKSPSNKRPRMKNPLSLSASASSILPMNKNEYLKSRSVSMRNGDFDLESATDDDFMCGTMNATSSPKHSEKPLKTCDSAVKSQISSSFKSISSNLDLEEDEIDDLKLPALPSEIGKKNNVQVLPSPKHLAGEAMFSESNSEDESTSSSSVQL